MKRAGASTHAETFRFLFRDCGISRCVAHGKALHGAFLRRGGGCDSLAVSSLIRMYADLGLLNSARRAFDDVWIKDGPIWTTMLSVYAKARRMGDARKLFDKIPGKKNVVAWTSLIAGYAQAGRAAESIDCFREMVADGVVPDSVAMVSVLPACSRVRYLELGRWIHRFVLIEGVEMTTNLVAALIDMYAKCGDMDAARSIFDSVGWKARAAWNAFIDGHCKLGYMTSARALFEKMDDRDCISFNSMITGYIRKGHLKEALFLFEELRTSGLDPDEFTFVGALTACANLGALNHGMALHALIVESSVIEIDVLLGTALVDMYAKCGRIDQAVVVFDRMGKKDVLAWTALITGLAMHGKGRLALQYFSLMQEQGFPPNNVAYVGVLNACSHSGLVEEGRMHFHEMKSRYRIEPEIEHYGCMVDLLGRSGYLSEAEELIRSMPMDPNDVIWNSLLCACKIHKTVDLAEKVAKNLLNLNSCEDGVFVQLYNIYVNSGRWKHASEIRQTMEKRGIKKIAGCSAITIGGQVHRFSAGDRAHPEIREIEETLREMAERLNLAGYVPIVSKITEYMDDEEKEHYSFRHSERLAVAYGIMRIGSNLPIYVLKNLRICEDCHLAIKLIAKIWNRKIVVRDRSRFHHFCDGHCSCDDFW